MDEPTPDRLAELAARVGAERAATWARLVRKGMAVYVENEGVLGVALTQDGALRAATMHVTRGLTRAWNIRT